jgi:hypothetical protein
VLSLFRNVLIAGDFPLRNFLTTMQTKGCKQAGVNSEEGCRTAEKYRELAAETAGPAALMAKELPNRREA